MVPTANQSSSRSGQAAVARIPPGEGEVRTLHETVRWLTEVGATSHWVVSCYLKLEPRDRSRGKYQIKLKNRIRDRVAALDALPIDRRERDAVARDLERVREQLDDPGRLPPGQGIGIFACEPLGLFESVPLPWVFRSRLAIDHSPLVRELAALDNEFGLVLCAAYDRTAARFFTVTAFGAEELPGLVAEETTRPGRFHGPRVVRGNVPGAGTVGEHNYHQRIRQEKHRHYARIAERLFELAHGAPVRGVILGGTKTDASAVETHLHPYVGKLVLGTARLNPKQVKVAEVAQAVMEVKWQAERGAEADHVRDLKEALGSGWAVNGVAPALDALSHGQVRTLLVDGAATRPGWRCADSGALALAEDLCRGDGGGEPVPDVIDEAIEEALRQGGHVNVIEDADARAAVDGLAAILRFRRR